jgi:cation diffusion facilitator CzcD-associated flavoprotein CzcO
MTSLADVEPSSPDIDVVVVGAGFAGMYSLYRLRSLGLQVVTFERGDGVGGTWYWNRYPGARCDVESLDYSYSFSEELQQEWTWTERYATQAEIRRYAEHVADRFDLRRDIRFGTTVTSLTFNSDSASWKVETDDGEWRARFVVMATGPLSRIKTPDIPGFERFAGEWHHTARWPHAGVDVADKRVGIIGTGSTGVQAIPQLAAQAEHLSVFQRTPNFSVPARNHVLDPAYVAQAKADYPQLRARALQSSAGTSLDPNSTPGRDLDETRRHELLQAAWAIGGGPAMLRTFTDLMTNEEVNATVAEFIRTKIRDVVRDPEIASQLLPYDHPVGAKRICVDTSYFETFNRDNVTLVDLRATPIESMTRTGIRTANAEYELDLLVLAIGFDSITGALLDLDITGSNGTTLRETWREGPRTYLGLMTAGFPNLFAICGPGSPAVLGNVVNFIEMHVDWIARCIEELGRRGSAAIEPTVEAQEQWVARVDELAQGTLFPRANSWFMGANIPGKPRVFLPYVGGAHTYRQIIQEVAENDYAGFALIGSA